MTRDRQSREREDEKGRDKISKEQVFVVKHTYKKIKKERYFKKYLFFIYVLKENRISI